MRISISNILLTVAFIYQTVQSKAINTNENGEIDEINLNTLSNKNETEYTENIEYKNFHYKFYCVEDFNNMCEKVKNNLNHAIDALTDTFEIYNPIVFDAYVDSFQAAQAAFIGFSMDTNFISLKTSKEKETPSYLYPQALVKQLNTEGPIHYHENDFTIRFNNFKYYPDRDELDNYPGITRAVIHEMIHGLGFINLGTPDLLNNKYDIIQLGASNLSGNVTDVKLFPTPLLSVNVEQLKKAETCDEFKEIYESFTPTFKGYSPFSVFEKNIVDIQTNEFILKDLGNLYKEFDCMEIDEEGSIFDQINVKQECYNRLSPQTKRLISEIPEKYYMKKDSIGILTKAGTVIPLKTFEDMYIRTSSICHTRLETEKLKKFAEAYENYDDIIKSGDTDQIEKVMEEGMTDYFNENYIMYYSAIDGIFTDEFMVKTVGKVNRHGLIGNGIVDIMKTIGWTEKGESKSDEIYYVDQDFSYPEQYNNALMTASNKLVSLNCKFDEDEPTMTVEVNDEEPTTNHSNDNVNDGDNVNNGNIPLLEKENPFKEIIANSFENSDSEISDEEGDIIFGEEANDLSDDEYETKKISGLLV